MIISKTSEFFVSSEMHEACLQKFDEGKQSQLLPPPEFWLEFLMNYEC